MHNPTRFPLSLPVSPLLSLSLSLSFSHSHSHLLSPSPSPSPSPSRSPSHSPSPLPLPLPLPPPLPLPLPLSDKTSAGSGICEWHQEDPTVQLRRGGSHQKQYARQSITRGSGQRRLYFACCIAILQTSVEEGAIVRLTLGSMPFCGCSLDEDLLEEPEMMHWAREIKACALNLL